MFTSRLKKEWRALKMGFKEYKKARTDSLALDWEFEEAPRLIKFKNAHKGEDCFIIGNGPSLNKMDLSKLNSYHLIGQNKIFLLFPKTYLNLSYHVAVNPLVIEQSQEEIKTLECPSFISHKASDKLNLSSPHVYKIFTNAQNWAFYKSIANPISEGYTVTFVSMQIAYYMGFSRIFLIGVDHNFNQTGSPNEKQYLEGEDINHFHPDYFKGMNWHLADLEGSETSYMLAKQAFDRSGRQIYDATVNGKLSIFPKISYEEALDLCKKK